MTVKQIKDSTKCLDLIVQSLSYLYPDDMTTPGITIAHLKNKNIYVSIARYKGAFAKDKRVVFKTRNKDLSTALLETAKFILAQRPTKSPIDDLGTLLEQK